MIRYIKQNFILIFFILAVFVAFNFWVARPQAVCPPEEVDFSLFWESWNILQEKYADKENLDVQKMIYGAISGMMGSLDDSYTVFLNPEDAKKFLEDAKGSFEGVGIEIAIKNNQLQVIAPLEGSPAQKAGLRSGDRIIEIDGESVFNMSIDEIVNRIRGPKGVEVILNIYREDWQETRNVEIVRQIIDIPSLKLEIREDNIAYLKLHHFSEKASYDFRQAAIEILGSPAEKIILDLRNNPGGYLEIAQEIAGWFLKKGQVVTIEDFGEGKEQKQILAKGNARLINYPIVVLINEGSASGSEILAGALRDNRGVKIIGQTSFGKGLVQELVRLKEGSALKITVAKWLTPKGELIIDKGLEPDVKIEITKEDYEEERDPQFDRALELIKEIK
jgi:carboxyl-terminal processing protease